MLKLNLSIIAFVFAIIQLLGQSFKMDSTSIYKKKALSFEEANIVSSYYHQEGIHSAVTGGIGTEKLSDVANVFDFKLSRYDGKGKKITYGGELGVDYYTSASSDKIDTRVSSASSSDVRVYPSISYQVANEVNRSGYGGNLAFSKEYDYLSIGGGVNYNKSSKDNNTEFSVKAGAFIDTYTIIVPEELRSTEVLTDRRRGIAGTKGRNSYDLSMSLARVLTRKFQMAITMDLAYQSGFLATPFHRVYFQDGSLSREVLPGTRLKTPVSVRANYFVGERFIIRSFYRYYQDDWGLHSNTLQIETPIKLTPFLSITPFYRYYKQSAIDYFAPYQESSVQSEYYTSDYDLSDFRSDFYGIGIRYTPFKTILNTFALSMIELRGAAYDRSDGLSANIITLNLQFKGF